VQEMVKGDVVRDVVTGPTSSLGQRGLTVQHETPAGGEALVGGGLGAGGGALRRWRGDLTDEP